MEASFSFELALTVSKRFRRASYHCWAAVSLAFWTFVVICFDSIALSSGCCLCKNQPCGNFLVIVDGCLCCCLSLWYLLCCINLLHSMHSCDFSRQQLNQSASQKVRYKGSNHEEVFFLSIICLSPQDVSYISDSSKQLQLSGPQPHSDVAVRFDTILAKESCQAEFTMLCNDIILFNYSHMGGLPVCDRKNSIFPQQCPKMHKPRSVRQIRDFLHN